MIDQTRRDKIRSNFLKIRRSREWAVKYSDTKPDKLAILLERLEDIYKELEALGVPPEFSASLFIFEFKWDSVLVKQFKVAS